MTRIENGREGGRAPGELPGATHAASTERLPALAREVSPGRLSGLPRSAVIEALLRRADDDAHRTPPGWHSAV
ncbi:hypothetical protein IAG44_30760 [Streptomyces roseirectus]|uniref:Uncharacterized protein n=1 Tax=Streptomyces roseirectus TaxID=2768066 RepID=A0A7H0IKT2_9ACTN|nr:hypothetical protein [Streptomyces roseirectus]QNP73398.1 hypothetical protein IAG44_30760 [Streptomyces roseirectus]